MIDAENMRAGMRKKWRMVNGEMKDEADANWMTGG